MTVRPPRRTRAKSARPAATASVVLGLCRPNSQVPASFFFAIRFEDGPATRRG
jgi:hypothetical protein